MKGITSYNQLNAYPGPGKWKPEDFVANITETRDFLDDLERDGVKLGDTVIGHIMSDEPECRKMPEDERNYLRAWADMYHRIHGWRDVYVNHCDPPWYDLNERHTTCSAAPTIRFNDLRIADRIEAARKIGLENFTVVALQGHITAWTAGLCNRLDYFGFGPCTQEVKDWLASRSNYQDAYEQMTTAYFAGALGYHPYIYNQHRAISFVDKDGNDQYGIRSAFSDAAHDLRTIQGWPGTELFHDGEPFVDRGTYSPGAFRLTAIARSPARKITRVVFGRSIDGGVTWTSVEDDAAPYAATFEAGAGETVIFRAQAIDSEDRRSIFAANMIHIAAATGAMARPGDVRIMAFGGLPGTGGQPTPTELAPNVAPADRMPVQSYVFNLTNRRGYFTDVCMSPEVAYTWDDVRENVDLMKGFKFRSGKRFFLRINVAALLRTDWFDDEGWKIILDNIALASRAAGEIGAIGFCLDNEQYNGQPFNYRVQIDRVARSFDEFAAQTRNRGRQFAEALGAHVPAPNHLITFGNGHIAKENWKKEDLDTYHMGLWPAFMDGMMDAGDDAEFIDGHEDYSAESYEDFRRLRGLIREEGARYSADPQRYRKRIRAAFSVWLKATSGRELDLDTEDFTRNRHTPEEFEHVVHYALMHSDGWIWLYSVPWLRLPQAYLDAVDAARRPHRLDFDFTRGRPDIAAAGAPADERGLTISAKGRADHDDAVVFEPMRRVYRELHDFPKTWKFRFDREDAGVADRWFATEAPGDWIDIEIGDWYGHQLDSVYTGYCWYRIVFDAPSSWAGRKLILAFGAVDEQAWVWGNGKQAGESTTGPAAWNTPFEIDVTDHVRAGRKNVLAVRVHNAVGPGGIWKLVKIFTDK